MSHVMPDFTDRLEQQLRSAALAPGASPRRRRRGVAVRLPLRRARLAFAGAVCVAVAVAVVIVSGLSDHATTRAYGKPLILRTAPVPVPGRLAHSTTAKAILGPGATFDRAYPISAFGGTAYVIGGPEGWCLSAPDPTVPNAQAESGVTCTTNAQFLTYGIVLGVGHSFIAALPQGVRNPTVQRPGTSPEELEPSDQGIVTATDLPRGTHITLYGTNGAKPLTITVS